MKSDPNQPNQQDTLRHFPQVEGQGQDEHQDQDFRQEHHSRQRSQQLRQQRGHRTIDSDPPSLSPSPPLTDPRSTHRHEATLSYGNSSSWTGIQLASPAAELLPPSSDVTLLAALCISPLGLPSSNPPLSSTSSANGMRTRLGMDSEGRFLSSAFPNGECTNDAGNNQPGCSLLMNRIDLLLIVDQVLSVLQDHLSHEETSVVETDDLEDD